MKLVSGSFIIFRDKNIKVEKKLSLKGKKISDISEIKGLSEQVQLEELDLSKNQIKEIKGLETLINLQYLNLSKNQIKEVIGLEKNKKLTKLYLDHNEISEVKGLDKNPNLIEINLSHNLIQSVDWVYNLPLKSSKPLQLLDLSYNAINDIRYMYLESLPILKLKMEKARIYAKTEVDIRKLKPDVQPKIKTSKARPSRETSLPEFEFLGETYKLNRSSSHQGNIPQVINEFPSIWPSTGFFPPLQLTHRGPDFVVYSEESSRDPAFIMKLESTSEGSVTFWTYYKNKELMGKFTMTLLLAESMVFSDPERKISMDQFLGSVNALTSTLRNVPQDREDYHQIGLAAMFGYLFQAQVNKENDSSPHRGTDVLTREQERLWDVKKDIPRPPDREVLSREHIMIIDIAAKNSLYNLANLAQALSLDEAKALEALQFLFQKGIVRGKYLESSNTIYFTGINLEYTPKYTEEDQAERELIEVKNEKTQSVMDKVDKQDLLDKASMLFKSGRYNEAFEHYIKVLELPPVRVEEMNYEDTSDRPVINPNQASEILFCCDRVLEKNPDDSRASRLKASIFLKQNKLKDALAIYETILESHPNDLKAMLGRGDVLLSMAESSELWTNSYERESILKDALACFQKILDLDYHIRDAWTGIFTSLGALRMPREELLWTQKALNLNPNFLEALMAEATSRMLLKQFPRAVECLNKASELRPDDSKVWMAKGTVAVMMGYLQEALQFFERALYIEPNNTRIMSSKIETLIGLNRLYDALKDCEIALELDPTNKRIWSATCAALVFLGKKKKARKCYPEFLRLYSNKKHGWCDIAASLAERGALEEALNCIDQALKLDPNFREAIQLKRNILNARRS